VPAHSVTNTIGIKTATFTHIGTTDPTTVPLVTTTRFGVAFLGTDDKIYHLVGRQLVQLDLEIPGLFGTDTVQDMEYNAKTDQLWVLFNTSRIWVYDFVQQGWTENHSLTDVHYAMFYRKTTGQMTSWGNVAGLLKTFIFGESCTERHDKSAVITQPFDDGGTELVIRGMEVDYAFTAYVESGDKKAKWLRMRHSVRSPKIVQPEESYNAANGRILVEYKIPANRPFYPTMVGRGHQFRFNEFQELRDIEIEFARSVN
jgi:hypothetical protein